MADSDESVPKMVRWAAAVILPFGVLLTTVGLLFVWHWDEPPVLATFGVGTAITTGAWVADVWAGRRLRAARSTPRGFEPITPDPPGK
jgi:hypothetical protein